MSNDEISNAIHALLSKNGALFVPLISNAFQCNENKFDAILESKKCNAVC